MIHKRPKTVYFDFAGGRHLPGTEATLAQPVAISRTKFLIKYLKRGWLMQISILYDSGLVKHELYSFSSQFAQRSKDLVKSLFQNSAARWRVVASVPARWPPT